MAYNPITGEFESGGQSYEAPTAGVGMAMTGMSAVGADVPLAFSMMENMPGITALAGHNARRYSNTMFKGGFLDVSRSGTPVSQGRMSRGLDRVASRIGVGDAVNSMRVGKAQKLGGVVGGTPQRAQANSFLFGGSRSTTGKTPIFKQSRVTNFTARPRIFNRMASVSQLGGVANQGFYTPFQGGSFLESMFGRRIRDRAIASGALPAGSNEAMFSGGVLGRMSTMSNVYSLENRLTNITDKATTPGTSARKTARLERRAQKIQGRLGKLDKNILLLQDMSSPDMGRTVASTINNTGSTRVGMTGLSAQNRLDIARRGGITPEMHMARNARLAGIESNRLKSISDSSKGVISRSITEYMGTMLDPSKFQGTKAFGALQNNIISALTPLADNGTMNIAAGQASKAKTAKFLAGETVEDMGKFGVRSLAGLSKTAMMSGQRMTAAKLATASGARALGLAIPGLNVIATASMAYDLTKLAATGVVAAGNFAKDAVKSMQGSIHKPLFGMGYQDTEVAATSRARGVMAIQNSRLNARSMLGSEASMMAAHFG
jgi:hypothetical protein